MKIELTKIKISDLFNGYKDSQEEGVVAYGGLLDVRPKYQREFVYKDKQRDAVIDTVLKGFPLNVMYWAKKEDGTYEVIDGQQRTISICQYLNHDFSIKDGDTIKYIDNWEKDKRQQIFDYELMVYICEGGDTEKLDWFRTINIAGEKLSDQELRNAVYSGPWLTQAKQYFSRIGCPAMKVGDKFVDTDVIRQGLLEKALTWIASAQNTTIKNYMACHQHDLECSELWAHYQSIIEWVQMTFVKYRKEMKKVDWGELYVRFKDEHYDTSIIESEVAKLMSDVDVTKKNGIYKYVLTREERWLSIRSFSPSDKRTAYERQNGICPICHKTFKIEEMEADHILPWSKNGHTTPENCQCLCRECNRGKSNKE
ncbi:MAG: DUF262 domain-containing protein [Prevotellaceae bacterium]|nr:DUF262 domain-containing protein [Prevotellaceae bacterium]